jgi:uncharacterized OB-fold protein
MKLPVPVIDDHDTGGFFTAAARGVIAVSECAACAASLHPPRPYCSACGSGVVTWRAVRPKATVYTWTTVEHAVHPAFPTPYTVALVELTDAPGVRLLGYFPGRVDLRPGLPVEACFDDVRDGVVVPNWRLAR